MYCYEETVCKYGTIMRNTKDAPKLDKSYSVVAFYVLLCDISIGLPHIA